VNWILDCDIRGFFDHFVARLAPKARPNITLPTVAFSANPGSGPLGSRIPGGQTIHLVMDNLNIHSRKSLADMFGAEMAAEVWNRFTVHRPRV
jgi:hypothetical protein